MGTRASSDLTAPIAPSWTRALALANEGCETLVAPPTNGTPDAAQASTIASASARVKTIGLSTNIPLTPALTASTVSCERPRVLVAIATISNSSPANISNASV